MAWGDVLMAFKLISEKYNCIITTDGTLRQYFNDFI